MKKSRIIAVLLALVITLSVFASCSNSAKEPEASTAEPASVQGSSSSADIKIGVLKGPTGMGAAYLWDKSEQGRTEDKYSFSLETDASVMGGKLISGEYDIAAIPTNAAAALAKKSDGKVQILAVNTLGILYVLSKSDISSVKDLENKTVLTSGQGSAADYVFQYVLKKNGLTPGENVKLEYASEHSEALTKAVKGEADIVMLPEPFVTQLTSKNAEFKVCLDLTKEWKACSDGELCIGALAINTAFAQKNADAVAKFLKEYKESVDFTNASPVEAGKLIEKCDILAAAVAQKAIPNCNITCITGAEMKKSLVSFYQVLFDFNPAAIGGAMPADSFYYGA